MERGMINKIIGGVLQLSATDPARYWEMSNLIKMITNANDYDLNDLLAVIEPIIEEEGLLAKYDSGWRVNAKTNEINESGGYIKYIARQQQNELQEEAGEARNRTAIIQRKTIKWSFGMSIAAILIAFAALIVSIISIAMTI